MAGKSLIPNSRVLVRGLIVIASMVAIGFAVKAIGLDQLMDTAWVDASIKGQGFMGQALFVAVGALATAVGLPRQLVAFLGGYAFGFIEGSTLAVLATAGGCLITFTYSRMLGRDLVAKRFKGRISKADAFLRENPFSMTVLIRLLPAGSNLFTCLVAGVSSVPAVPFLAGSALGYIPQTIIFALIGSGVNLDPGFRITFGVGLFLVSGILGVYLYRRYRHGKTFDDSIDSALDEDADPDGSPSKTDEAA